jgi:hypothetical protein
LSNEAIIYQHIGEFMVSFQYLEHKLREIGWFILDPKRQNWPPKDLRTLSNAQLIDRIQDLFAQALPACGLDAAHEESLKTSFSSCVQDLHSLRRDRNRILHSAFIELKAGGDFMELQRTNPKLNIDEESGEVLFDQEFLTPESFSNEMKKMAEAAIFLGSAYLQLIHRYPNIKAISPND